MLKVVAGVDEAGRGPLCGEVVAAAVVLHPLRPIDGLADSKQLSAKRREVLFVEIQTHAAAWCIASASVDEIDTLNILQATLLAMKRAVDGLVLLEHVLDHVLVDGNQAPRLACPVRTVVKGDVTEPAISAASILAKVHRDRLCVEMDRLHPGYGFADHKGYGTAAHVEAIVRLGPCAIHRRSFQPVKGMLSSVRGARL